MNEANKLFNENMNLAYKLANKYKHSSLEAEDMQQEALLALWTATSSFDPARNDNFRAHAYYIVSAALQGYCQNNLRSISTPNTIERIHRYYRQLMAILEGSPILFEAGASAQEVATTYEHSAEALLPKSMQAKVRRIKKSICSQCKGKDSYEDKILVAAQLDYAGELEETHAATTNDAGMNLDLKRAVASLSVQGALAFTMRMNGFSQQEIAEEMNLTKQRISQILSDCRALLRKRLTEETR